MPEGVPLSPGEGNVQKSPSSKATAILAGGAYIEYVSTAKGRERRWRLFSTFPVSNALGQAAGPIRESIRKKLGLLIAERNFR